MKDMSLDFSQRHEFQALANLVGALQRIAGPAGNDFVLIGAAARDLMLISVGHPESERRTEDTDVAVLVGDWAAFDSFREALIASGQFEARAGSGHQRLYQLHGLPLDIVPFGEVESDDRTITWPPKNDDQLNTRGLREAFETSEWAQLPGNVRVRVPNIPSLVILKALAWHDRKHTHPGKDAQDLLLYMRAYLNQSNSAEHVDRLVATDFDYEEASAGLLAHDIRVTCERALIVQLTEVLTPEADANGSLLLARQSRIPLERARRLIEIFCTELAK